MTVSMLATLRGRPAPPQQRADPAAIRMKIVVPQRPSGPPPAPRQQIDLRRSAAVRQAEPVRSVRAAVDRAPSTAPPPSLQAPSPEPPLAQALPDPSMPAAAIETPAAAAALRLDAAVIRRASSQGKGALQRMAEAAGVDLQRRPVSAGVSLASNLTRSVRPGCLDPDPAGSLLSIPSIAISAITGKCS